MADVLSYTKYFRIVKSLSILIVLYSTTYYAFIKSTESTCEGPLLSPHFNGSHLTSSVCQTNIYKDQDGRRCLRSLPYMSLMLGRQITFIGDEKLQLLSQKFEKIEKDISEFIPASVRSQDLPKLFQQWSQYNSYPSVVIFGFQPQKTDSREDYSKDIAQIFFLLDQLAQHTHVIWFPENLYTKPLQFGNFERKMSIDSEFQKTSYKILSRSHVQFWNGGNLDQSSQSEKNFQLNNSYFVQLILNLLCNKFEMDETFCCGTSFAPQENLLFHILIFGYTVGVLLTMLLYDNILEKGNKLIHKYFVVNKNDIEMDKSTNESQAQGILEAIINIIKLIIILSFFYVCDRTSLFPSTERHFTTYKFFIPLIFCLAISIATWNQSGKTAVLSRDITDEWKGWMQIVILVYHASGASTVLPIYIYVRVLVSAYVFLTGFGHFAYYWSGKPMTLRRYFQVMIRMNLLTLLLCLLMDNPYQVYYFVPLISFWFSALYLCLCLPPNIQMDTPDRSNRDYAVAVLKIVLLTCVILALSMFREVFDMIFMFPLWQFLFVRNSVDSEWWFRWSLDRFSVVYGMLFYLAYNFYTTRKSQYLKRTRVMNTLIFIFGVAMMTALSASLAFCWTKVECNALHPYIVWIPILGFILFRHSTPYLEGSYSVFFSSIGRTSLELFICQYHIWLSESAMGLLQLIPNGGLINIIATTMIFVSVCYEMRDVMSYFSNKLVPKENWKAIRNITILICCAYVVSYLSQQ